MTPSEELADYIWTHLRSLDKKVLARMVDNTINAVVLERTIKLQHELEDWRIAYNWKKDDPSPADPPK